MKKQLLLFLLLLSAAGSAQIVNIPDTVLKNILTGQIEEGNPGYFVARDIDGNTISIDTNDDNEIQFSEAALVYSMVIDEFSIADFDGLQYFENLEFLHLDDIIADTVALPPITSLKRIVIEAVYGETAGVYDLSGLTGLEIFESEYADKIESVDFTGDINLKRISIDGYSSHIIILGLDNNDMPLLERIEVAYTIILVMPLDYLPALTHLILDGTRTPVLDLSGCPSLTNLTLFLIDIPEAYINLKNGNSDYESFDVTIGSTTVAYFCIDEGEEANFENNPWATYYFSTYCSFFPEENHNTIAGNLTFDSNNDGCDSGDTFNGLVKINITDNNQTETLFTNVTGNYQLYPGAGAFTITPELENDSFTISPESADITFAEANSTTFEQNFCITPNGVHPDAEIVISGWGAQPGFDTGYTLTYKNKGNQTLSGNITLTYDDTVLDYLEATPAETTAATNTITWNYNNLQPFESRNIQVTMNLNGPMETPAVNIDDILPFTVSITPATSDQTPEDNTFTLAQTVVGSYDPNDITCLEGVNVDPAMIGEYLHYNINFENTGTAPATFIVITDEINEAQFDISTLQLLNASHDVETKITGNTLEFRFEDINLAADGGKGNVVFKIKTLNTLQENDNVMQQANIFFDYNFPIETNEANTVFAILSRGNFEIDNSVGLYPNPSKGVATITANTTILSIQLYDIQGRLLQVNTANDTTAKLDISAQPSGLYFVKITTEKGVKVEKLIKE